MKIMWFSRHELSSPQKEDLERIYGVNLIINQVNKTISSAKELTEEINLSDVVAIVAPPLQQEFLQLCGMDKPLIFCKNGRIVDPIDNSKVQFVHQGWFRIKEIRTIYEPL